MLKISDIIDAIEMQSGESCAFYNTKKGDFIIVPDESEHSHESHEEENEWLTDIKDLEKHPEKYIQLPSQWEIDGYRIMQKFCWAQRDQAIAHTLLRALDGRGAFRQFKNRVYELNIDDKWYLFKAEEIGKIAIDWCKENGIEYQSVEV